MPYNIYKSDGSQLVTLDDYIIDNNTLSINLIGKNVSGYGEQQNENFLYLLENFSKETPPGSPLAGQIWFDKKSTVLRPMVYDGGTWRPLAVTLFSNTTTDTTIASGATITSQAPGDFWFDTSRQQLFINTGSSYSLIGPEAVQGFAKTRLCSETILDSGLNPHPVIKIVLNGEVIGILSNETFMGGVEALQTGFNMIYRGLTLKNYDPNVRYSTTNTDVVLHGMLDQLDESYPRRNQDEHLQGNWYVDTNYMLQFGSAGLANISFQEQGGQFPDILRLEHGNGVIRLSSNGSNITYNGDSLVPNATNIQDLGAAGQRFNNVYTKTLNAGGPLVGSEIVGIWNLGPASQFNPDSDSGNNLGTASLRWDNVYAFGLNSGNDQGTIKGDWQLQTSIDFSPQTDNTNNLGTTAKRFNTIYATKLSSSDPFTALTIEGEATVDGSIVPAVDQQYNIGSSLSKFNTIYSSNAEITNAQVGSLSATISQLLDSFTNTITRFDRDAQLTANSDSRLPTQRSVKAYVDATKNQMIALIQSVQDNLVAQITNAVASIETIPVGTILYAGMSLPPAGYLECAGQSLSTGAYPQLFSKIGYTYGGAGNIFKLPDLRGQFVRGWDHGRNLDQGRSFGTDQDDLFESHQHASPGDDQLDGANGVGGWSATSRGSFGYDARSVRGGGGQVWNTTAEGGSETRPTNVALLPIIKY